MQTEDGRTVRVPQNQSIATYDWAGDGRAVTFNRPSGAPALVGARIAVLPDLDLLERDNPEIRSLLTVVYFDLNGNPTQIEDDAVEAAVYLDAVAVKNAAIRIPMYTRFYDVNNVLISADKCTYSSTDAKVASVAASGGVATVTVPKGANGVCEIVGSGSFKHSYYVYTGDYFNQKLVTETVKVEGNVAIYVRDYTPRMQSTVITLNSWYEAGVSVPLLPAYSTVPLASGGNAVSSGNAASSGNASQSMNNPGSDQSFILDAKLIDDPNFIAEYFYGVLTIKAADMDEDGEPDSVKNGTYKNRPLTVTVRTPLYDTAGTVI